MTPGGQGSISDPYDVLPNDSAHRDEDIMSGIIFLNVKTCQRKNFFLFRLSFPKPYVVFYTIFLTHTIPPPMMSQAPSALPATALAAIAAADAKSKALAASRAAAAAAAAAATAAATPPPPHDDDETDDGPIVNLTTPTPLAPPAKKAKVASVPAAVALNGAAAWSRGVDNPSALFGAYVIAGLALYSEYEGTAPCKTLAIADVGHREPCLLKSRDERCFCEGLRLLILSAIETLDAERMPVLPNGRGSFMILRSTRHSSNDPTSTVTIEYYDPIGAGLIADAKWMNGLTRRNCITFNLSSLMNLPITTSTEAPIDLPAVCGRIALSAADFWPKLVRDHLSKEAIWFILQRFLINIQTSVDLSLPGASMRYATVLDEARPHVPQA